MKPDSSNSRALGVGEQICPDDYVRVQGDDDFICLDSEDSAVGDLVTDDDIFEFRRILMGHEEYMDHLEIAAALGIETEMGKKALAVALENIKVLDSKQKDYGSGNIAGFGEYGVLVRATDKLARLNNLLTNVSSPKNESVLDSWMDLSNYAIIATLCNRGEWR